MSEWVSIGMDAAEIVDRVDDMLAWMAIASEPGRIRFEQSHFMRAVPYVHLGGSVRGRLTPNSLIAKDQTREEFSEEAMRIFAVGMDDLPRLLELPEYTGVRLASMMEFEPGEGAHLIQSKEAVKNVTGDDIVDHQDPKTGLLHGVRYQLASTGETSGQVAKQIAKQARLPQTARVFREQRVYCFADGKSASTDRLFAYWNRRFFDLNKRPLVKDCTNCTGGHLCNATIADLAIVMQHARRRMTSWEVELSLGMKRTGVALETDAIGARDFVNMIRKSDTPKGRRKALVHWVDAHMRRHRATDEKAEIEVRGHLRGMSGLDAGRYYARIWPARGLISKASNGGRYDHAATSGRVG